MLQVQWYVRTHSKFEIHFQHFFKNSSFEEKKCDFEKTNIRPYRCIGFNNSRRFILDNEYKTWEMNIKLEIQI